MGPTQELVDELYRERVLWARAMTLEQRMLAGPQIYEDVCERMAAGLRDENPGADEATIQALLLRRLEFLRRLRGDQ